MFGFFRDVKKEYFYAKVNYFPTTQIPHNISEVKILINLNYSVNSIASIKQKYKFYLLITIIKRKMKNLIHLSPNFEKRKIDDNLISA